MWCEANQLYSIMVVVESADWGSKNLLSLWCDGGKNTVHYYIIVRRRTEKRSLRERRPREEKKNINLDDRCAEKKSTNYR